MQDVVFVAAKPFRGHPYFGVSTTVEIMSDEDYPTKFYDAALISAAPELYDTLEALLQYLDDHEWGHVPSGGDTEMNARKALAKAFGEAS